ncbi:hypothetical protein JCM8097_004205 [Rhodosporidiobolus ruineniae]
MAHYQHSLPPHPLPPPPATGLGHSSFSDLTLATILEDLCARFIVNLPAEELESMDRVCFQIEQAHWYYEDFIRPTASNPTLLPSYGLKAFSLLMFKSCPLLHDLVPSHGKIWTSFMAYKERVPVCGAIMISEYWDKVLLVKGWNKGSSWSFPRGKINKQEPEAMCAVREVLEETGFDLTSYFPPHQLHPSYAGEEEGVERVPYYVELVIREQKIRLYFVPNVPEATRFETRTRKEISKIDWFPLSALPTWNQNQRGGKNPGSMRSKGELANGKQAKYYMVTPFISHLKLWVDRNKPKGLPSRPSPSSSSIPLSPEAASPRPLNPTPHHAALKMHPLVPWDDATYHLPSETELDHSDAGETSATTSTEDEAESEDDFTRLAGSPTWQTTQQGTEALQALFFGGPAQGDPLPLPSFPNSSTSSLSQHTTPPARPLPIALQHHASSSSLTDVAATPPQVAYERQQSFLQPRPRQSESQQGQQARLLELLTGQELATPPPLALSPASTGPQADGTGSLLGLLNGMNLSSASPSAPLPAEHSYPSSSQAHASLLFGGLPSAASGGAYVASPPPETYGAVESAEGRSEEEKREKHQALLRALLHVAVKSPEQPPPLDDFGVDEPGLGGTPRSDEIEALFGSAPGSGLQTRRQSTLRVGQTLDLDVDDEPWPPTIVPPTQGVADLPLFYSQPNRQLVADTPLTQTSASGGWQSLSSSDEASDGSRRARGAPVASALGKGSLLAILNQPGAVAYEEQAAVSSPSAYSQHSGGGGSGSEAVVKDPLQILREYRNRQMQQEAPVASLPSPPAPVQPVASLPPPQPEAVPAHAYASAPLQSVQQQQAYYSPPQAVPPAPLAVSQPPKLQQTLPPPAPTHQPFLVSPAYPSAPPLPNPGQAYQQPFPSAAPPHPAAYSHLPPPQHQPVQVPGYPAAPLAQQPYPTTYAPPPQPMQHLPPQPTGYPSYPQAPPGSYPPPHPHSLPPLQPGTAAQQPLPPRQPQPYPTQQPAAAAGAGAGGKPNAGALLGLLNAKG